MFKQIIKLCLILSALLCHQTLQAQNEQAGCPPIAASLNYSAIARPDTYTKDHVWSELFTFPKGWSAYDNDDFSKRENPMVFTYDNSNPELLVVENCGYDSDENLKYRKNQLRYHLTPYKTGNAELKVHCTYNGVTTTKVLNFEVLEIPDNPYTPLEKPNNLNRLSGLRGSTQSKVTVYLSSFFNMPAGWNIPSIWEENGITWGIDISNPELISNAESTVNGNYAQSVLTIEPITADCELTAWIERNGVRKESKYVASLYGVKCADDEYKADKKMEPFVIPVLSNDSKLSVPFEIKFMEQPENGEIEIAETTDKFGRATTGIKYTPKSIDVENWSKDTFKYRLTIDEGKGEKNEYSEASVTVVLRNNPCISKIIEFVPAPGQFINSTSFLGDAANHLIGTGGSAGSNSIPTTTGLISLGSFGGYVIVGFDNPIPNDPRNPYGVDFTIGGNAFKANAKGYWSEPGAVMVMKDENGNGLPDDTWYELAGSDYWFSTTRRNVTFTYEDPGYTVRQTIPYTTSYGEEAGFTTNRFHGQSYFPDAANYPDAKITDGKLSLSGTLIKGVYDRRTPSYIESYRAFPFGYADNHATTGDLTVARNPYYAENGNEPTDGFDISWAVDKDGNYVTLDQIDFVKIYCCVSEICGWLGESSTEIGAFAMTEPDPDQKNPGDYYLNYAGITQLQVIEGNTCQFEGLAFHNGRPIKDAVATWSVKDPEIGTIDSNGLFTAKKTGTTQLSFKATDLAPADSFEVEVVTLSDIVIDREGNTSTSSNSEMECFVGEKHYLNTESVTTNTESLNNTYNNRYIYDSYTWTAENPEMIDIRNNGFFIAKKTGETTLTVKSNSNPELTTSIKVKVKDIPSPEQSNNYLVIEDRWLEQEELAAKYFACSDIFDASGKVVNVKLTKVEPEEYADKFYIKHNRLYNNLIKGDYREYRLSFEGELNGVIVPIEVPLLHTSSSGTIFPQTVTIPDAIVIDPATKIGKLDLSSVFTVTGSPEIYKSEYRLPSDAAEGFNLEIEDGILLISTDKETIEEGTTVSVEGRISRAVQKRTIVRTSTSSQTSTNDTDAIVPVNAKWETAVIPVIMGNASSIDSIIFNENDGQIEIYDINGIRYHELPSAPGIYIIRNGSKSYKILK